MALDRSELAWVERQSPRLKRSLARLPGLSGMRLALSIHIEIKMAPLLAGLMRRGARLFLTTCNPATVRDEVVAHLASLGAETRAWRGMSPAEHARSLRDALAWKPTHLCEMGADLTAEAHRRLGKARIRASMEATGSGIARLKGLRLRYPIINWDEVPIKAGLHNRRMVGIVTWHAFFERTRLTLHEKRVLVLGYGPVGRGVAESARAYGGSVIVCERDPGRALEASYAGWPVVTLAEGLAAADVVVTATGASRVLSRRQLGALRDGAFLLNVGHRTDEIDPRALAGLSRREVLPFIEEIRIGKKTAYLFAGGSMANLTAGHGDSLNAFDIPLAMVAETVGYLSRLPPRTPPGVQALPREVWRRAAVPL